MSTTEVRKKRVGGSSIRYQVVTEGSGKQVVLFQSDFEDKEQFKTIAQNLKYKILCDGKDVTKKYKPKTKMC